MRYAICCSCLLPILLTTASVRAEHLSGKWNCEGMQTEMNACAAARFEHADDELNVLYRRQIDRLRKASTKARLRQAQRAWIAFRDKSCVYQTGPQEKSGSIWPLEHFACMERETKQRALDMKQYLACQQTACPN